MERHGLRDGQFARIENLLPGRPGTVGRNSEVGNRLFVNAVIWKFRTGVPWRDLPEHSGGWCNTHRRFSRWAAFGRVFSKPWRTIPAMNTRPSAQPLSEPISTAQEPKKSRCRSSHRALARRAHGENPCDRRCAWQSAGVEPHSRAGP